MHGWMTRYLKISPLKPYIWCQVYFFRNDENIQVKTPHQSPSTMSWFMEKWRNWKNCFWCYGNTVQVNHEKYPASKYGDDEVLISGEKPRQQPKIGEGIDEDLVKSLDFQNLPT